MTAVATPSARPRLRDPGAVVLLAGATAMLWVSAVPVDADRVSDTERAVFRFVNDRTVLPFVLVWPLMQLGNIGVVGVTAAAAAARRRWRLAAMALAGGAAAYLLAKVVKDVVPRGRPSELLIDVRVRGAAATGRGYVSGHAAVAGLLATLLWPYLGRRARVAVVLLAAFVCLSRVYVGAHLPLDVVGGAALGVGVAAAFRLVAGRRSAC